jgi:AcrR family transcriptional regulator
MARAGLDREAVLRAAVRIVDRRGFAGLTMAGLAAELNVRPPSLYSHYDSLADIEDALTLLGLEGLLAAARDAAVGLSGGAAIDALARSHRRFGREHPGLYAATLRHAEDRQPAIRSAASAYLDLVLAVLRGFHLDGDIALHVARGLHAALRGFVALETGGGIGLSIDVDESFEILLEVLKAGIAGLVSRAP